MQDVLDRIQADLRNQYVLGYTPPTRHGGKYHKIKVEVTRKDLIVRAQERRYDQRRFSVA